VFLGRANHKRFQFKVFLTPYPPLVPITIDFTVKLVDVKRLLHTLKRISNWPLYKTGYCATYLINASNVWLLCIVHINLSINGKKNVSMYKTVHAKIGYVLGLLVLGNGIVEFGRKVFLVDCLL